MIIHSWHYLKGPELRFCARGVGLSWQNGFVSTVKTQSEKLISWYWESFVEMLVAIGELAIQSGLG